MKILLLLLLLLLAPHPSRAADGYLDVTAPAGRKLQLSIAPATVLSGPAAPDLGRELADLFGFDLGLFGSFSVAAPGAGTAGADLVLKTAYALNGSALTLECRLFDPVLNRELAAKRYTGGLKELRRMGHAFSDEVLRALTGEKGPFTGKIAYVTKLSGNKEIFVMDYDGRNPQRVTHNGSINLNPEFAPSGREIIYTSYKKGNPDLYRRELFTGAEARISARPGLNAMGAYAPDGRRAIPPSTYRRPGRPTAASSCSSRTAWENLSSSSWMPTGATPGASPRAAPTT
jgi:TolB protein